MLHAAEVTACSQINTKQTNTVRSGSTITEC